ncbi:phospholipase/carboxylesterase [Carnobacterium iners]|uniref:Phospholipase/carboxylesterase n=1 Tax=Carnobacterium iners TaxID=1073423 RepID=A0A1X7N5W3_9LACT|nr:dienelactone hydrolase family protein [Carnobacterium iners]SEK61895.1 phospholipase/carboxylesterase [Carnobacterium iners]SMH31956.1 phospholipase/carboxylesterase [Carnobacterium iners]
MMQQVIAVGTNNHTIISLHGTGGTATSLFELAHILDPKATKIGFQGEVNENGMNRYFARYPDGSFDLPGLDEATQNLYDSVIEIAGKVGLEKNNLTIIGYSNGANLAKNLLKNFSDLPISTLLLFHPSPINSDKKFKRQSGVNVLMTSGKNDSYISESQFKELETSMLAALINVETYTHDQGHQLTQEEIEQAKSFLLQKNGGF